MSEPNGTETTESAPRKGRKLIILALPLILILLGGGAFGYFYLGSSAADDEKTAKAEKNHDDEDSHSDEEDSPEETGKKKSSKKSSVKDTLPSDENVKQVVELQPFVVNLTDPDNDRYLRLTLSVGVGEDEGGGGGHGGKPDVLFTTRIRNAMLAVLTLKSSDDVLTVEGKAKLRKELLKAAQSASEHPHVEAIYITDFIVQL